MDVALRCTIAPTADVECAIAAEIVSMALFDSGAAAVGEELSVDGSIVLVAGFATSVEAANAQMYLTANVNDLVSQVSIERSIEPTWAVTQRSGLEPTQIGPWHIRAPWDPAPDTVAPVYDIVIDPGVAFGHGGHPSTRLAIALLERAARSFDHVIDLGTGTGVLAIIAARLGLDVVAFENDSAAAAVARDNIAANGQDPFAAVLERVTLIVGDASAAEVRRSSLVVANVTLDVHREIASACAPAERVIVSGLLCRQVAEICSLYPDHEAATISSHGEWASVKLVALPAIVSSSSS